MKKLLLLIPAIGMSLTACQKERVKDSAANEKSINNLITIQNQIPARYWSDWADDCVPNGHDCFDDVICTPSWFQRLIDGWLRIQRREREMRKWCLLSKSDYVDDDSYNNDFGALLGQEVFQKVLSGELQIRLRMNDSKENTIFVGVFETADPDQVKMVFPITKAN